MSVFPVLSGLSDVADSYDAFMVDQFGVLHDGRTPYAGAVDAMTRLTALNKPVIVLTNSGKRAAPNMDRIGALGFNRSCYTALVSSGEVTWQGLRTGAFGMPFEAGGRIHVIGRDGEDYGLDDLGLIFDDEPRTADFIVIAGSNCPATGLDHYSNMLAPAAAARIPALCANPDRMMLTSHGLQPAPGAIGELYEQLGGRVTYIGKPFGAIYHEAAKAAGSYVRRVLCIGDSLAHDVLGGASAGFDTALVRTGVLDGVGDAELETMIAEAHHKPTHVLARLTW